jgi:CheY-like chemotaxis protein
LLRLATPGRGAQLVRTPWILLVPGARLSVSPWAKHKTDNRRLMKLLIVEDNPDMRELLGFIVKRLGYIPVLAIHGKEGVEKAVAEKPKLILMDMMMPVMDGWEATRALRSNPETKEIPILAVTALIRPHELRSCLDAGCNGYVVKPLSFVDLESKIRGLLTDTALQ